MRRLATHQPERAPLQVSAKIVQLISKPDAAFIVEMITDCSRSMQQLGQKVAFCLLTFLSCGSEKGLDPFVCWIIAQHEGKLG